MTDQGTEVVEPGSDVIPASEADPATGGGAVVAQPDQTPLAFEHEHHHPTPRQYVLIAVVLVVITAVEIATSYIDTGHSNLIIVALFAMAAIKFFLVAAWYMHMKVDQPFFRRVFVVGMIGAGVVYGILLLVFSSTVLKS
jgi:cytochrome c oxidase subunit 4